MDGFQCPWLLPHRGLPLAGWAARFGALTWRLTLRVGIVLLKRKPGVVRPSAAGAMPSSTLLLLTALVGTPQDAGAASRVCAAPDAEVRVDHVVVAVQSLEETQQEFVRLGFTLKPGRLHSNGLLNAHFKFVDGTALEVMSVSGNPGDAMARDYTERINAGGGGAYLALGASQRRVLEVAGLHGLDAEVLNAPPFRYVTFSGRAMGTVFALEYERQFSEDPRYLRHANGARGLREVWVEAGKDLEAVLVGLGGVFCGLARGSEGRLGRAFAVQNGSIVIVDPPSRGSARVLGVRIWAEGASVGAVTRFPEMNGFWVEVGPATRPSAHAQDRLGCMDATVGPWYPVEDPPGYPTIQAPPPDESMDSLIYTFPLRVRLLEEAADRPWPGRRVEVPEEALSTPHVYRSWSIRADTLTLVMSTGFAGVNVRAIRDGGGWRGSLRTSSDVAGLLRYERAVALRPTDCNAPPPVPASADRHLPRSVTLGEGSALALGALLPTGLATVTRRSGALLVPGTPRGVFEGADTVIAESDRGGRLFTITLKYGSDFDIESLVRRLEGELGSGERSDQWRGLHWRNRTTSVYVFPGSEREGGSRVVLTDPRLRGR